MGRITRRTDVDHCRNVVLHHLFVDRVPVAVGKRWRAPVSARGVRVEIDRDRTVLLDALELPCRVEEIQSETGKRQGEAKRVSVIEESLIALRFWEKEGTPFGWFYAASRYVQTHRTIDDAGIDDVVALLLEKLELTRYSLLLPMTAVL